MPLRKYLYLLSYLSFSVLSADSSFDEKLKHADFLREASLYDSSITAYHDLIRNFEENCPEDESDKSALLEKIHLSLAKVYFQNENYHKTIETLKSNCDSEDSRLLMAMAYNELKEYARAVDVLESFKKLIKDQSLYEIAIAKFYLNDLKSAEKYFQILSNSEIDDLVYLSKIYLARIDLNALKIEKVSKDLSLVSQILPKDHVLQYELHFLQAQVFFEMQDYAQAAAHFEKAIPKRHASTIPWLQQVLYHLGWSYLKEGDHHRYTDADKLRFFQKAENVFKKMKEDERHYLSLGACYLNQAHVLKNEQAYKRADEILSKQEFFLSDEAKLKKMLLKAQAAPSYIERDNFYRQLTTKKNQTGLFFAKSLYLKGLNDFEKAEELQNLKKDEEASKTYERAAISFKEASELLKIKDQTLAGLSLKYRAQCFAEQKTKISLSKAISILDNLIEDDVMILNAMTDPDEIYYLKALCFLRLIENDLSEKKYNESIEESLKTNLTTYPKGKFADLSFNLLATFYYQNKDYEEATKKFLQLVNDYPKSSIAADALFKAALSLEIQNADPEKVKTLRKKVYTEYKASNYADESYFLYYSYQEYIQGDRVAIKHLESFAELFPKSPFVLNAYYLMGMDYKRDRKTLEGKWIRKKNLNEAIDYFQLVESFFDELYEKELLNDQLSYFLTIRYLAMLERGLANFKIAEEAQKGKKEIYLEYAESVFLKIIEDFKNPEKSLVKFMNTLEPYPHFQEESSYWLGVSYRQGKNDIAAIQVFREMLDKYQASKITRGYFLSRVWYELGLISMQNQDYNKSLSHFFQAEDAAKGKILNSEQKLDLWIQQSFCYLGLKQYDSAILILSKVINDDTISGLRLKAMFLRAEMYEAQGRKELARKQLEATSKKGGEWALKAKAKLESDYGY